MSTLRELISEMETKVTSPISDRLDDVVVSIQGDINRTTPEYSLSRKVENVSEMIERYDVDILSQLEKISASNEIIADVLQSGSLDRLEDERERMNKGATQVKKTSPMIPVPTQGQEGGFSLGDIFPSAAGFIGGTGAGALATAIGSRVLGGLRGGMRGGLIGVGAYVGHDIAEAAIEGLTDNEELANWGSSAVAGAILGSRFGPVGMALGALGGLIYTGAQEAADAMAEYRNAVENSAERLRQVDLSGEDVDVSNVTTEQIAEAATAAAGPAAVAQMTPEEIYNTGMARVVNQNRYAPIMDAISGNINVVSEIGRRDITNAASQLLSQLEDLQPHAEEGRLDVAAMTGYTNALNRLEDLMGDPREIVQASPEELGLDQASYQSLASLARFLISARGGEVSTSQPRTPVERMSTPDIRPEPRPDFQTLLDGVLPEPSAPSQGFETIPRQGSTPTLDETESYLQQVQARVVAQEAMRSADRAAPNVNMPVMYNYNDNRVTQTASSGSRGSAILSYQNSRYST